MYLLILFAALWFIFLEYSLGANSCNFFMTDSKERRCTLQFQHFATPAFISRKSNFAIVEETCHEWSCTCKYGLLEICSVGTTGEYLTINQNQTLELGKYRKSARFHYSYDPQTSKSYLKVLTKQHNRPRYLSAFRKNQVLATNNSIPSKVNAIKLQFGVC